LSRNIKQLASATSTPLASIFGSGFLIIVPILAGAVGVYSIFAMAGVCVLAYAVGGVIRHNIVHVEPVLAASPSEITLSLERISDLALAFAYIISVCLYLHILSSFVLGSVNMDTGIYEDLLTSGIIILITAIGLTKGLGELGILETIALYITLLIIFLLLFGFAYYDFNTWQSAAGIIQPQSKSHSAWEILTIVAGTLIVVQGFETTRYLEELYPTDVRVKASRWSQVISAIVYVLFVAAALPVLHTLNGQFNDNSLLKLAGAVSAFLVAPLVIAAALSQFSAAIADTVSATGDLEDITHNHIKAKWGTLLVGGVALALTWSADTLELVAIASRAFAFYYMVQCLVAISVTSSPIKKFSFLIIALVLGFITIFAVPAS